MGGKKQLVVKTHVSEANYLPLVAVASNDVTLRKVEEAAFVRQTEICQPQLTLKQDFHSFTYSRMRRKRCFCLTVSASVSHNV